MLTYTLTKNTGISLYEQLYRAIKADILSGRLPGGTKLPSIARSSDSISLDASMEALICKIRSRKPSNIWNCSGFLMR